MTPLQISWAVGAALIALVGGWGVIEWGQKLKLQHEFDAYRNEQARLVINQQKVILAEVQKNAISSAEAVRKAAAEKARVEAEYGPVVSAYNALAGRMRDRDGSLATSASGGDAARIETGPVRGRDPVLEEINRRAAGVVESAGRVAANLKACTDAVARYRVAIGWEDAREAPAR